MTCSDPIPCPDCRGYGHHNSTGAYQPSCVSCAGTGRTLCECCGEPAVQLDHDCWVCSSCAIECALADEAFDAAVLPDEVLCRILDVVMPHPLPTPPALPREHRITSRPPARAS